MRRKIRPAEIRFLESLPIGGDDVLWNDLYRPFNVRTVENLRLLGLLQLACHNAPFGEVSVSLTSKGKMYMGSLEEEVKAGKYG